MAIYFCVCTEDTQADMFGAGSDEEGAAEEEGEADSKWRMERHEREKWLQEQQVRLLGFTCGGQCIPADTE